MRCARLLLLCLVFGAIACGEDDAGFQVSVPTRTPTPTPEPCGASSVGTPCTAVVDATPVPGYCTIQFVHLIGTPQYVPTLQYTCLPSRTPCPGGSCTIGICFLDGTAIPCPTPTPTPPFVWRSYLTPCSVGHEDCSSGPCPTPGFLERCLDGNCQCIFLRRVIWPGAQTPSQPK